MKSRRHHTITTAKRGEASANRELCEAELIQKRFASKEEDSLQKFLLGILGFLDGLKGVTRNIPNYTLCYGHRVVWNTVLWKVTIAIILVKDLDLLKQAFKLYQELEGLIPGSLKKYVTYETLDFGPCLESWAKQR